MSYSFEKEIQRYAILLFRLSSFIQVERKPL